jgi:hypothetical protein
VNLAQTDFIRNPQVSLLGRIRRQSGGVIAGDAPLKDSDEAAVDQIMGGQPVLQSSTVLICRGLL